jgi:hypothetical protein
MSGDCELGRGLRRREKNANKAGAGRFEKPAPDARAAPPEAQQSFISRKTVAVVPLTGLSFGRRFRRLAGAVAAELFEFAFERCPIAAIGLPLGVLLRP